MSRALQTVFSDFTPSPLQEAAIRKIQDYKQELRSYGMYARTSMELEFMVQDQHATLCPGVVNLDRMHSFLMEQEQIPMIDKVEFEGVLARRLNMPGMATQYEVSVGDYEGFTPVMLGNSPGFMPENVAAVVERLKKRSLAAMLRESTCLTPSARMHDSLTYSPNFAARPHADAGRDSVHFNDETSALHVNVSLYDREGRNLFGVAPQLMDHCAGALVALQNDAALPMLPGRDSLQRLGANDSAPAGIGIHVGKCFGKNRHTSVCIRGQEVTTLSGVQDLLRIENRLPGADTDPFVSMAVTLAAVVDAVRRNVEKSPARDEKKVRIKIKKPDPHQDIVFDIPGSHGALVEKFQSAGRVRELLGEELYAGILREYASPGRPAR